MSEPFLTAREIAERLSFQASTIVDWYEAGKVPGFKIGGRLRFRWSEVEAVLEQQAEADRERRRKRQAA